MHLDKPYYAVHDIIWFKAYVVNTLTSGPSTLSGLLYVELINDKNKISKQLKLPIISGVSWGDFSLPDTLTAGNYRIRAYTQWMRNAGAAFFFDKTVKVGKSATDFTAAASGSAQEKRKAVKEIAIKIPSKSRDVQFFPEGGALVSNLPNKIGIKVVNSLGLGEDISGTIVDNVGQEVATFNTTHLGMGNVLLNPELGKTYVANVRYQDGTETKVKLPVALTSGYVLSATETEEEISVKVMLSEDLIGKGDLKLLVSHNNNTWLAIKTGSGKQLMSTSILKKNLPEGIVQLTLFNGVNVPVAERLVFVHKAGDRIETKVRTAKDRYNPKEETILDLESKFNGKPVRGTFSISVTNTTVVKPDEENESNIFASLLLTSDLAGYVEKPNYYFLNESEETRRNLDNLMLTQGWRRLLWKDVLGTSPLTIHYQPEHSLKISGVITTNGGKPIPRSKVSLISFEVGPFAIDTLTDDNGRFNFDSLAFLDSAKYRIQALNPKGKPNVEIKLDAVAAQQVTKSKNAGDEAMDISQSMTAYLQQSDAYFQDQANRGLLDGSKTLKEVKITAAKKNPAKNSSNLNGPGNADAVITAAQLKDCFNITQCLERFGVAGMMIKNGLPYLVRNGGVPMQIILDGVMIDSNAFMGINVFNVQTVEVLKDLSKTAVYGRAGANAGVLIITSKRAGDDGFEERTKPGVVMVKVKGYDISRQFYSPVYKASESAIGSDHRSTIYWSPNIIPSENGTAKINYYNAGDKGTYRVVVEGMDMSGNLARSVYNYEVE